MSQLVAAAGQKMIPLLESERNSLYKMQIRSSVCKQQFVFLKFAFLTNKSLKYDITRGPLREE